MRRSDYRFAIRGTFFLIIAIMLHVDFWLSDAEPQDNMVATGFWIAFIVMVYLAAVGNAAKIGRPLK